MSKQEQLINTSGEVRELTAEDFANAKPLEEVMPPEFVKMVFNHQEEMEQPDNKPQKKTLEKFAVIYECEVEQMY